MTILMTATRRDLMAARAHADSQAQARLRLAAQTRLRLAAQTLKNDGYDFAEPGPVALTPEARRALNAALMAARA